MSLHVRMLYIINGITQGLDITEVIRRLQERHIQSILAKTFLMLFIDQFLFDEFSESRPQI